MTPAELLRLPREGGCARIVVRCMPDGVPFVAVELEKDGFLAAVGWRAEELAEVITAFQKAREMLVGKNRGATR